ncbi:hypothetical protein G9P44_002746 [Scheffersomyces stipitis]|nr:hypothetical protein G9P44_002746 [Scheffersomyces stipitis]
MVYPSPLKASIRKIADNVVIASCPFSIFESVHVGARMALIKHGKDITIWSPLKYSEAVFQQALQLLVGDEKVNITNIVVVNVKHCMAAGEYKKVFPDAKIIASQATKLAEGVEVDVKVTYKWGAGKLLGKQELTEIGITSSSFTDNFQLVYMDKHKNRELILHDTTSKTLFVGDTLFNLGIPGTTTGEVKLEQFSEEAGVPGKFFPHSGWSFLTRYLQPESRVGKYIMKDLVQIKTEESKLALKTIGDLDFDRIVMCHGNVIDKDGKAVFNKLFNSSL